MRTVHEDGSVRLLGRLQERTGRPIRSQGQC